jgi:hypothetical protein
LLEKCVSRRSSATSLFLVLMGRSAPRTRTLSASNPLLPSFAWWRRWVDWFVDLPYLPGRSGETFISVALTIVICIDFIVGQDVGHCKLWTIWRQAASFMSRVVHLLILN